MTYDWDKTLNQAIGQVVNDPNVDEGDRAVLCVLVALRKAVQGKLDLDDLSIACIEFDEQSRQSPFKPGEIRP